MKNGTSYGSQAQIIGNGEDTENRYIHIDSLEPESLGFGSNEDVPLLPNRPWYKRLGTMFCGSYDSNGEAKNGSAFKRRLETMAGVFAPVALGQFANNLFLRTGNLNNVCPL